jgi:NADPH:quinone reductase-like Zn-dependent oxidoreductase
MRAAVIGNYQEAVGIRDLPRPQVGGRDVLIEVHAASVNPVDFKIRDGKLKVLLPYSFPLILGQDLAGVVVETGAQVKRFKKGDAVYARMDKMRIGSFAEYAAVDESLVALKPQNLSMTEAASIPLAGLTAWQALFEKTQIKAGERVLIHAGSGGVGTLAIQLARAHGAWVATTTSTLNVDWVRKLGANQVIDYKKENFQDKISGLDVVLDTLGGECLLRSFKAVRPEGCIVSVSGMADAKFAREWGLKWPMQLLFALLSSKIRRTARRAGVRYEFLFMHPSGEQLEQIRAMIEAGKIRPVIDRVFPLDQAKEALEYVEASHSKGKVVIQIRT